MHVLNKLEAAIEQQLGTRPRYINKYAPEYGYHTWKEHLIEENHKDAPITSSLLLQFAAE